MRVEQSTRKGKARAPAPEVCTRCIEKMLLCKLGTGKSTSCQVCKAAKAWCKRPGEEEVELKVVLWRKHTKMEWPCGEKKKMQMKKSLKGSEKSNRGLVVKEVGGSTLRAELKLLFWGLFMLLNCQNDLLEVLLEVKTQKVTLLLSIEINEMEEIDEEEVMEVDEEEVRELSMEGPKEVEELEEGPGKVEGSKQGVEASGSAEVEKGSQSAESAESGRNGGDDMEV